MTSVFGILSRKGAPVHLEHEQALRSSMKHWETNNQSEVKSTSYYFGAQCLNIQNIEAKASIYENQGYLVVGEFTLFNRNELKQRIGLANTTADSEAALILLAYQKWGEGCLNYINGEFAFVIFNQQSGEAFIARDHHGIKPLYYYLDDQYFAFATEMKALLSLPFVSKEINEQYVADFICRIWLDNTQTLYRHINRFPPAHWGSVNKAGVQFTSYWDLSRVNHIHFKRETDYIDAFEEKLVLSVQSRVHDETKMGSELSGGLDSSMVNILLQRNQPKKFTAYSYVLPPKLEGKGLYSDRNKVVELAELLGIDDLEFLTDEKKGMLDSLAWNQSVHDEPPFDFNPLFRDGLYQMMHNKQQHILFSGFGGDEMASSQASGYLKKLYREGKRKLLSDEIKAIGKRKGKAEWLLFSSLLLKLLVGDRFVANSIQYIKSINGDISELQKKLKHRPLLDSWFKELNMEDRFNAYQRRYSRNGDFIQDQIRRMQEPHVALRLENQAHAARSFQVEYRYPLLDVDLMEFYLGLPTELKARNGQSRYIFKKVLERYLPEDFVWGDTKKGSSNPQVLSRTLNDGQDVESRLFSIEKNHLLWKYLDQEKLRRNRISFKNWHQSTTDFSYLLLADKLK